MYFSRARFYVEVPYWHDLAVARGALLNVFSGGAASDLALHSESGARVFFLYLLFLRWSVTMFECFVRLGLPLRLLQVPPSLRREKERLHGPPPTCPPVSLPPTAPPCRRRAGQPVHRHRRRVGGPPVWLGGRRARG